MKKPKFRRVGRMWVEEILDSLKINKSLGEKKRSGSPLGARRLGVDQGLNVQKRGTMERQLCSAAASTLRLQCIPQAVDRDDLQTEMWKRVEPGS